LNLKPQQVIQSIKDSDCSLVSYKNFSEILPSNSLSPGPGKVGQGGLKVLHLRSHSQKIRIPQPKIFFKCKLQDLPHLLSFWLGQRLPDRRNSSAKPRAFRCFFLENLQNHPDAC